MSPTCLRRSVVHACAACARRRIFALLLAILWLGAGADLNAQEKSLLWKVSKDTNSIYLLGSIHYLRKENYPLKKAMLDAFEASKRLVLEIDLNTTSAENAQRVTLEKAVYRDGTSLPQNISEDTYQLAARRATQLGIDMRLLNPMKAWFAALTLIAIKLQAIGLDPSLGVDRYLATEAKRHGKPTSGLETLEFQIGLLDQLSKKDQELMLRETVGELDLLDQNINDIVRSWIDGNDALLAKLLLAGMMEYPEVHQKIVVERNRRWLPEIEKLLQQGSGAMVVVGAAHLVGQDGVIEMLKAKGYSVEQK
ncbi:MAG TPA: TraB/GumN family protein [Candidatus Binatia bacterium]|jgi:hypothetical protein